MPITALQAQELRCSVSVNYNLLQGNDFTFLRDIQSTLEQYINDRVWTEDRFEKDERISCSFGLTFTKAQGIDRFEVTLDVTASRPVYQSSTETTSLKLVDNAWAFSYVPNQAIVFDPNRFDPLASVIDYYAFLILGFDYDSFSEQGGTPFFEKARRIVELAQTQGGSGWQYGGTERTRGVLIQELLDPRMKPLRQASFDYHHHGLDHFLQNPNSSRQRVLETLSQLEQLSQESTRKHTFELFFAMKSQELVSIFENSPFSSRAYSILLKVDSGRSNTYDRLTAN
ncbi:MAG: DUF4835 family protein [Bacteroidetes Order II. Incertae sedis bacterium]|nr:DUF4835 family protein [Bacteroidetes Order II. bacterium]